MELISHNSTLVRHTPTVAMSNWTTASGGALDLKADELTLATGPTNVVRSATHGVQQDGGGCHRECREWLNCEFGMRRAFLWGDRGAIGRHLEGARAKSAQN